MLPVKLSVNITKLFQTQDELSLRNIRGGLWPFLLVFPLSVIIGDLRYFDLKIAAAGFESYELMLFTLGLGWLVLACLPKHLIIPFLRISAVISAVLLPLQIFMPNSAARLALFMAFQFLNGLCAACAFSLFCFELNNIERLFGMVLIQFYYGFYYTVWRAFPAVQAAGKTWGGAVVMAVYLVVVFACGGVKQSGQTAHNEFADTAGDGKGSAVPFILGLDVIYYIIMCMINYIEWAENSVSSLAFGLGAFVSIALIIFIQLLKGRNAMYIWLLFLALSMLGLGALLYDSQVTLISGSFAYGLGDGLGYIIIYYICAGAIKQSKSFKMFKFYCFVFFVEYFVISGFFSIAFNFLEAPNKVLAFGVVLILGSVCLLLMPLMQKKLFEADWTDGLYLRDMPEYSGPLLEVEEIDSKNHLNLTSREQEVFTMLLEGRAPKEIAYTLKVSPETVHFHQKNLYRKLGIQSRAELFARHSRAAGSLSV
jgi:DNA-binding CsgD family transcriptional regulator